MRNPVKLVMLLGILVALSSTACQKSNTLSDRLTPVPDESVKPVSHWKTHHVKLKSGRTATFTIPAEYSDKYDNAARLYCFQDLGFEDRIAYGIKDDNEFFFAICSSYEGLGEFTSKQLDSINIRDVVLRGCYENIVPVVEKYKDTHGQIYYHLYDYKAAPVQYSSRYGKGFVNKSIIVSISSATVYGDTIYWTSMRFLTSAMNFDVPTYRKITHSVRVR